MNFYPFITVAAADSKIGENDDIDFICTGRNDELTINKAINLAAKEGKGVYLLNGLYHVDAFYDFGDGGPLAAIWSPALYKEITIIGQSYSFEPNREGVQIDVSEEALNMIGEGEYSVFRTGFYRHISDCKPVVHTKRGNT